MVDISLNDDFVLQFHELLRERDELRQLVGDSLSSVTTASLTERCQELELELDQLKQRCEAGERQRAEDRQRQEHLQHELQEAVQQLGDVRRQLQDEQRNHQATQGVLIQTSKALSDALERQSRTSTATPIMDRASPDVESAVEEYRDKITSLERTVSGKDHDIVALKDRLRKLEDEKNALISLNFGLEEKIEQLQEGNTNTR